MKTEETINTQYWLLAVSGTFQHWDRLDNRVLTEPRRFEGYVQSTDWGYSVGEEISYAHRFKATHKLPVEAKTFGPWWYTVTEQHWIEVNETLSIKRTVLS